MGSAEALRSAEPMSLLISAETPHAEVKLKAGVRKEVTVKIRKAVNKGAKADHTGSPHAHNHKTISVHSLAYFRVAMRKLRHANRKKATQRKLKMKGQKKHNKSEKLKSQKSKNNAGAAGIAKTVVIGTAVKAAKVKHTVATEKDAATKQKELKKLARKKEVKKLA